MASGAPAAEGPRRGPGQASAPARLLGTLRRLLSLWRLYAWMDLRWLTRDARGAVVYYLSDLVLSVAAVTATLLLVERFGGIGPWSKPQVVFMLGFGLTASGLLDVFFGYNVKVISRRLGRGQLDHTLLQPQPLWMALLTEGFNPFSESGHLLTGLALLLWAGRELALPISAAWLAALLVNLLASAAVVLAFSYLWGSLAFWAPRAAEEISGSALQLLDQLKVFPLEGLAPGLLGGLLTALPAGLVAWLPSRALLGVGGAAGAPASLTTLTDLLPLAITPLAALALAALALWSFDRGRERYGRVGSARYSSIGHRR